MIPTGGVSQLSGCCPPYGYHFIVVLALLIFMTQVPVLAYNYYFMYDDDNIPIEYKYVLVSVGWMIVVLYVIHFVLDYIKNNSDE